MSLIKIRPRLFAELNRRQRGEAHIRRIYQETYGKELNLINPTKFSEKLFSRMLAINNNGGHTYSMLADKLAVRKYVDRRIGAKHLLKLLWVGNKASKIPFSKLPDRYIIKATHGSGMVIRVEGKINEAEVIEIVDTWTKTDYGLVDHEHHYSSIPRRIIIEELLDDGHTLGPLNYSFWSFHGEPAVIQVDNRDRTINPFFDTDWKRLSLSTRRNKVDVEIGRPDNLSEMLNISQKLSKDFDFVRVDLYTTGSNVYFGELTFTPGAGRFRFMPEEWDERLGALWR